MDGRLPCNTGRGAQELLTEFSQTGRQEPFEEIARRYAGMVYNVALQITRDAHDAEDATQATFLTLAVHAKTTGKIRYVGPWLRKVSQRLALDIRRSKKRRHNREVRHATDRGQIEHNGDGHHHNGNSRIHEEFAVSNGLQLEELRAILREELDKLPAKYRMPLILYYFGGLSPEDMGKELGCKTNTLGVRLHRGRKMLAENLQARGIGGINAIIVGAMITALVDSFVKDNLVFNATQAAARVAANGFIAETVVTAPVASMIHSVTAALKWSRAKGLITALIVLMTTLTGAAKALRHFELIGPGALQKLNLFQYIRPLMDKLLSPPRLVQSETSAKTEVNLAMNYRPGWAPTSDFVLPEIPPHLVGTPASVASERLMASKFNEVQSATPVLTSPGSTPVVSRSTPIVQAPRVISSTPAPAPRSVSIAPSGVTVAPPVRSDRTFTIDRAVARSSNGMDGHLAFSGGTLRTNKLVVGDSTSGVLDQTGGDIIADEQVVIAAKPTSNGTYNMSGKSTLQTPRLVIGDKGNGTFVQSGGDVVVRTDDQKGEVVIAQQPGSTGNYVIKGGTVQADNINIGKQGTGAVLQSGGVASFTTAQLGEQFGGKGLWSLTGGIVNVASTEAKDLINGPVSSSASPVADLAPTIVVGGEGKGTFLIEGESVGPAIQELPGTIGSTLIVRTEESGEGTLRGRGTVSLSGPLVQNGQVIADGGALDLSAASKVFSTIENPAIGGTNGWFARANGSLALPAIRPTGFSIHTWGEDERDPIIDLVNSVRLRIWNETSTTELGITLLDPENESAPALPTGGRAVSLWEVDSTEALDGIDLTVRYDDNLAASLGISEEELGLWVYEGDGWRLLEGSLAGINTDHNLLWGTASNPTYIAAALLSNNNPLADSNLLLADNTLLSEPVLAIRPIATLIPEPSSVALLMLAGATLLRRRRV